jgi:hypothetical protein
MVDRRPTVGRQGGTGMAKVAPYHSSNPSDPDVYHDHDNCPTGQQIPAANRVSGTDGYRRCQQCTQMD